MEAEEEPKKEFMTRGAERVLRWHWLLMLLLLAAATVYVVIEKLSG